ncbi:MAG: hypothetical protein JWO20_1950 [Candidatus Angelobacter sp.]|nr:hypothetical protein [Candidatus Angelobacter sp.]
MGRSKRTLVWERYSEYENLEADPYGSLRDNTFKIQIGLQRQWSACMEKTQSENLEAHPSASLRDDTFKMGASKTKM